MSDLLEKWECLRACNSKNVTQIQIQRNVSLTSGAVHLIGNLPLSMVAPSVLAKPKSATCVSREWTKWILYIANHLLYQSKVELWGFRPPTNHLCLPIVREKDIPGSQVSMDNMPGWIRVSKNYLVTTNPPALKVSHATSSVKGKTNLVLLGDILPAPRPQVLEQAALPHELRHQEYLALHSSPLPFLDYKAKQSYKVLVLQRPLRISNQLQALLAPGRYSRHDFCLSKKVLGSNGGVFDQLFHSHLLPPRIGQHITMSTSFKSDQIDMTENLNITYIGQAWHLQTPPCQSFPAKSHPPSWSSSPPDHIIGIPSFKIILFFSPACSKADLSMWEVVVPSLGRGAPRQVHSPSASSW